MRSNAIFKIALILLLIPFLNIGFLEGQTYTSNYELLRKSAEELALSIADELNRLEVHSVILAEKSAEDESTWFFNSILTRTLLKGGIKVYKAELPVTDLPNATLNFRVISLGVKYLKAFRRRFWSSVNVEREGYIKVTVEVIKQPEGQLILEKDFKKLTQDVVPMVEIDHLQKDNFLFTKDALPQISDGRGVIEPALIIGVTGVIIYLFFSLRSG
ncbi:MAG: hypothetical protein ACE5QV_02445 [Fidelibacterota bacterium]